MTKSKNPETIALHGGDYRSDPATTSVAVPVYRTTSYQFNDTDHAANLFALKEFGKNQENTENIQKAFNHRAKMNGLSSKGEWSEELEKEFAA